MTKNNKVECWEPKNCGGSSSKCGDCITIKFKLLADWVPYTGSESVPIGIEVYLITQTP